MVDGKDLGASGRERSAAEDEMLAQFGQFYSESLKPVNMAIERDVCGCAFGGVSWATRAQVDRMANMLALGPGDHLMDLGAGSGWPGLYLAGGSGCDVTLMDLPHEGLVMAAARAKTEDLTGRCLAAVADGESLPCPDRTFDALTHSDVLCCLPGKTQVLAECARVIRPSGQMIFSVISIAPGLGGLDRLKVIDAGPPYIEAAAPYEELLEETGWRIECKSDLTADYLASVKTFFRSTSENSQAFIEAYGEQGLEERMSREGEVIDCIERGHMERALYRVVPVG